MNTSPPVTSPKFEKAHSLFCKGIKTHLEQLAEEHPVFSKTSSFELIIVIEMMGHLADKTTVPEFMKMGHDLKQIIDEVTQATVQPDADELAEFNRLLAS